MWLAPARGDAYNPAMARTLLLGPSVAAIALGLACPTFPAQAILGHQTEIARTTICWAYLSQMDTQFSGLLD